MDNTEFQKIKDDVRAYKQKKDATKNKINQINQIN